MVSDSRNNQARLKKAKNADAIGLFPLTATQPSTMVIQYSSLLSDLVKAAVVNSLISFNSIHLD